MSAFFIALVASGGMSVWIYNKLASHTGYGNTAAALKGAAISFVLIFAVIFTICLTILHN